MSENGVIIPPMKKPFSRDNDQQNHWVQWGTQHFQTNPMGKRMSTNKQLIPASLDARPSWPMTMAFTTASEKYMTVIRIRIP